MKLEMCLIAAVGLLGTACANTDVNLRRETARYIGNVAPDEVTVSNVQRGMTNVDWSAATPRGHYKCSSDDMLRRVLCVKRGK